MYDHLFDEVGKLTEPEETLIKKSVTSVTATMNQSQVVSRLYNLKKTEILISNLIKSTESSVNKMIKSNESLAEANKRYSLALNILTGALVLVGFIQLLCR